MGSTSVVYDLVGTLVSTFQAQVTTAQVYDGYGSTDNPGDFVMVGIEDPDGDKGASAETQQKFVDIGGLSREESGSITCVVVSWNGNNSLSEARGKVKAITQVIENTLRSSPNFGNAIPGLLWIGYGSRTQVTQMQAKGSALVMQVFDVQFKARI